jgi:hypothetical protein
VAYKVFLSHSARDAALVAGIKAQIEVLGIAVYLFEEHAEPGRSITSKIQDAIRTHDALLALVTPSSSTSGYVHQEIGYALGQGKPAVAIVTPGVDSTVLAMLNDSEYVRLDPASPLIGMSILLAFLQRQAAARRQKEQEELLLAMAVIALLLIAAYSSSTTG